MVLDLMKKSDSLSKQQSFAKSGRCLSCIFKIARFIKLPCVRVANDMQGIRTRRLCCQYALFHQHLPNPLAPVEGLDKQPVELKSSIRPGQYCCKTQGHIAPTGDENLPSLNLRRWQFYCPGICDQGFSIFRIGKRSASLQSLKRLLFGQERPADDNGIQQRILQKMTLSRHALTYSRRSNCPYLT